MDPFTGSAALKVFGMTAGQLTNSPPVVSGATGRADSGVSSMFSTGTFNVGAPSFGLIFAVAGVAAVALVLILRRK